MTIGKAFASPIRHARAEVGDVGAGGVARLSERREHAVAGVEAGAEQLVGDGDALALVAEVADDAEQIARVGAGRQGADAALGLEDRDRADE